MSDSGLPSADERARVRAIERLQKMNQLQEKLLGPGGLEERLTSITENLAELFGVDVCRIWLVKPGDLCDKGCVHAQFTDGPHACPSRENCLHLMASAGKHARSESRMHQRVPFGAYKIGQVGSGRAKKFITNDVDNDPRALSSGWGQRYGLVSFAAYRLTSALGEPIGVLAFFATSVITPEEDAMLESMAHSISQAIQRAQAEDALRKTISELQDALAKIKTLRGLLPICANCKKVRDDKGYWNQIEVYVRDRSDAEFSHSICPECMKELYPEHYARKYPDGHDTMLPPEAATE